MIEVKNLFKKYTVKNGIEVKALDDVSLKIDKVGMVFLLGKSGAGKSTLLNVLGGLDRVDSGEIIINGKSSKDFSQSDFDSYRNTYSGFIFQEYNLLDYLTLEENIAFPLSMNKVKNSEIKKRVHEIAKNLGIEGLLNKYPDECSGGQKQRTAIARALVNKPSIIIADEPTGNLDSKNTSELLAILKNLNEKEGKTIIMVTHDVMVGSFASRLLYIQDGTIKEQLSRKEFKTQEDYFYNISKINSKEQLISLKK